MFHLIHAFSSSPLRSPLSLLPSPLRSPPPLTALICLTCTEEPDMAFTNYRLVQSVGLAIVFGFGSWVCVSVKLYLLMTLLVVAIMFYVLAEYQLRHDDDDVFEDP